MEGNGTFTAYPRGRRRSRAARIWLGILVGVVAGNAVAAGTYLAINGIASDKVDVSPRSAERPGAASAAHRLAGLEAMDRGDFDVAEDEFLAALRSPSPAADLPQLLKLTQELREQREAPPLPAENAPAEQKTAPPPPEKAEVPSSPPPVPESPPAPRAKAAPPPPSTPPAGADAPPAMARRRSRPPATSEPRNRAETPATSEPRNRAETPTRPVAPRLSPSPSGTPARARRRDRNPSAVESTPAAPAPDRAAAARRTPTKAKDELPLCPKDYTPPAPSTPYAVLPRRCRPRPVD